MESVSMRARLAAGAYVEHEVHSAHQAGCTNRHKDWIALSVLFLAFLSCLHCIGCQSVLAIKAFIISRQPYIMDAPDEGNMAAYLNGVDVAVKRHFVNNIQEYILWPPGLFFG